MPDQQIQCPHCGKSFELSEALTHGIREAMEKQLLAAAGEREAAVGKREALLRKEREALEAQRRTLEIERESAEAKVAEKVEEGLRARAAQIEAKGAAKGRREFEEKLAEAQAELAQREGKIKGLVQEQSDLRRQKNALEQRQQELELEVARRIDAERESIRQSAGKAAQEAEKLKIAEKDKLIQDLNGRLSDLQRKIEQGSQQMQGEVQELQIEAMLRAEFPLDKIEPVAKGMRGADTVQRVSNSRGEPCGVIVWESKRTKDWSPAWIAKLKEDARAVKGDFAVIVSTALPPDVRGFTFRDGVFIAGFDVAPALAGTLRMALQQLAQAARAGEGKSHKMAMVYDYLRGNEFRNRLAAVIEAFGQMRKDLGDERRALEKIWAKREQQLRLAETGAVGIYGEIEAIIGGAMPRIEGLDLRSIGEAAPPGAPGSRGVGQGELGL